jgi:hypothetical protein
LARCQSRADQAHELLVTSPVDPLTMMMLLALRGPAVQRD